jgi:hypothetical protein
MGSGKGITALMGGNRFIDNLPELEDSYTLTPAGFFGKKGRGRSHVRIIESSNPGMTAYNFFMLATKNWVVRRRDGDAIICQMRDNQIISYREASSSDGSPVVEFRMKDDFVKIVRDQKIHFVKG